MSRSISISFRDAATGQRTDVEVPNPYDLLGGQRSSIHFWGLPQIKEIGIERLAELGVTDPVMFFGWDDLAVLRREISLLDEHLATIDFPVQWKATWLCNLIYCYHTLVEATPKESEPWFTIG